MGEDPLVVPVAQVQNLGAGDFNGSSPVGAVGVSTASPFGGLSGSEPRPRFAAGATAGSVPVLVSQDLGAPGGVASLTAAAEVSQPARLVASGPGLTSGPGAGAIAIDTNSGGNGLTFGDGANEKIAEVTAYKGTAGGYAELDATANVPASELANALNLPGAAAYVSLANGSGGARTPSATRPTLVSIAATITYTPSTTVAAGGTLTAAVNGTGLGATFNNEIAASATNTGGAKTVSILYPPFVLPAGASYYATLSLLGGATQNSLGAIETTL